MNAPKKKILLIDDNKNMTEILCYALTAAGYEARVQNNSRFALKTAKEFMPDLVLLDVDMPGLDGGDVMQQLKSQKDLCNIPIIFLTGLATRRDLSHHTNAAETILPKPISIHELTKEIEDKLCMMV